MINLSILWKTMKRRDKCKRDIKEVNFNDININEYTVIDVRSRREFRENHLNESINIPLPEVKRNIQRYVQNKDEKLLICCQSGIRSKKAVEILEEIGYTNVYNLKNGIENI